MGPVPSIGMGSGGSTIQDWAPGLSRCMSTWAFNTKVGAGLGPQCKYLKLEGHSLTPGPGIGIAFRI